MVEQLIKILKEGRAVTPQDLAVRLRASKEEVLACIEFLIQTGYLARVQADSGCGTSCSGCSGGCRPEQHLVMWKWVN